MDSDNSSTTDDSSYEINTFGSSECSSNNTEEQIESHPPIEISNHIFGLEQKYLSALSFSMNHTFDKSLEKRLECEESCSIKGYPGDTREKRGIPCNNVQSHQNEMSQMLMNLDSQESNWLGMSHNEYTDDLPSDNQSLSKSIFVVDEMYNNDSRSYPLGQPKRLHSLYSKPKAGQKRDLKDGFSDFSKVIMTKNVFLEEVFSKDQSKSNIHPSVVSTLQEWKFNPNSNFLSKNPMLLRSAFHMQPADTEDRGCFDCKQNFPYFDLSSVRDPSKVFLEKFSACDMASGTASATGTKGTSYDKQYHDEGNLLASNSRRFDANANSISDLGHNQEFPFLRLACGGSSWESVLGRSNNNVFNSAEDQRHSSLGKFEMPLEFIIDKCLLQEIMLQYPYIMIKERSLHFIFLCLLVLSLDARFTSN